VVEATYSDVSSFSVRLGMTGTRVTGQTRSYSLNFYDTPISFANAETTTVPEASLRALMAVALGLGIWRRRPQSRS